MATYGVTSSKFESQLKSLGLTLLEPNDLKNVPKVAKVFIYDYNGVFDKLYLNNKDYIENKSSKTFYPNYFQKFYV